MGRADFFIFYFLQLQNCVSEQISITPAAFRNIPEKKYVWEKEALVKSNTKHVFQGGEDINGNSTQSCAYLEVSLTVQWVVFPGKCI